MKPYRKEWILGLAAVWLLFIYLGQLWGYPLQDPDEGRYAEIPREMLEAVMRESFRLLKPGGLVVHQDVPTQKADMPAFDQWLSNWQVIHNDEPYWQTFAETSVPEALAEAGFAGCDIFEAYQPQVDGPLVWYMVGARKS